VSTHAPPHADRSAAHVSTQLPNEHICPEGQALPHAPQFAGSLSSETQDPPQVTCPAGQAHWPPRHVVPPAHDLPQAPQFAASLPVSTHAPPHDERPDPQTIVHVPALHTRPVAHAFPHAPQFRRSLARATQTPLQAVSFAGQTHVPPLQIVPPLHGTPQAPQPSQAEASGAGTVIAIVGEASPTAGVVGAGSALVRIVPSVAPSAVVSVVAPASDVAGTRATEPHPARVATSKKTILSVERTSHQHGDAACTNKQVLARRRRFKVTNR